MPDPQIIQYIQQNSANFSKEDIENALLSAGWAAADIAAGFAAVVTAAQPTPQANIQTPLTSTPAAAATQEIYTAPPDDFMAEMERRRTTQPTMAQQKTYTVPTSHVKFNSSAHASTGGGIIGLLVGNGLAANESQANMILIGVIVVAVSLAVWFVWPKSSPVPPLPTQVTAPTEPNLKI